MKAYTKKGFTLIETMVAIFVLTLVVAVAMAGIQSSLKSSNYSRDQITAYYLAEEAIEYVRSIRDSNLITGAMWLDGIEQCTDSGVTCRVDAVNGDSDVTYRGLEPCTGSSCILKFTQLGNSGLFDHRQAGENSKFTRYITVVKNASGATTGDEITVTATVTWSSSSFGSQSYSIKEQLYNIAQ